MQLRDALARLRSAERQDGTVQPFILSDFAPELLDVAEAAAQLVDDAVAAGHEWRSVESTSEALTGLRKAVRAEERKCR